MKRSMLLVLAGFGLASMLFALVAFVGEGSLTATKEYAHMKVLEDYDGKVNRISITYPDGKSEEVQLVDSDIRKPEKGNQHNFTTINNTINKLAAQGYHVAEFGTVFSGENSTYYVSTYVLERDKK